VSDEVRAEQVLFTYCTYLVCCQASYHKSFHISEAVSGIDMSLR
jgi:hypothetical protein